MSSMDAESSPYPPPKRRRYLDAHVKLSSAFWFDDGDIVLAMEDHRFKIHRSHIQCSEIFSDMLVVPQPAVVDSVDGCPLVHLADSAQDWCVALRWMYDPVTFESAPHPVPFPLMASALRIAHKYEIAALRKWAVDCLRARWPSDRLENMDIHSLPYAAEAIVLAQECDVPEMFPAAFYALSIQRWCFNADGGRSHLVLSPADLRRLIVGRERLAQDRSEILADPLKFSPRRAPFEPCAPCREPLQRYWRTRLASDPESPHECWMLRELHSMASREDELFQRILCVRCWAWHRDISWARFRALKEGIPKYFGLH